MAFPHTPSYTGTDQEILNCLRAAIAQVTMSGQAYDNEGNKLTRADLETLHRMEKEYQSRVNAASNGPTRNLAAFHRRG